MLHVSEGGHKQAEVIQKRLPAGDVCIADSQHVKRQPVVMALKKSCWLCFLLTIGSEFLLMNPAAAAESSDLTCVVTQELDGSFKHTLSREPRTGHCNAGWEDQNRTAIANNHPENPFDPKLVLNLTCQSVSLRLCLDYLRYTNDCLEGPMEEAVCRVNCSSFLDKPTEKHPLTCLIGGWCPDQQTVLLFVVGIVAVCFSFVGLIYCIQRKRKCRKGESAIQTTSYTAAQQEVKIAL